MINGIGIIRGVHWLVYHKIPFLEFNISTVHYQA